MPCICLYNSWSALKDGNNNTNSPQSRREKPKNLSIQLYSNVQLWPFYGEFLKFQYVFFQNGLTFPFCDPCFQAISSHLINIRKIFNDQIKLFNKYSLTSISTIRIEFQQEFERLNAEASLIKENINEQKLNRTPNKLNAPNKTNPSNVPLENKSKNNLSSEALYQSSPEPYNKNKREIIPHPKRVESASALKPAQLLKSYSPRSSSLMNQSILNSNTSNTSNNYNNSNESSNDSGSQPTSPNFPSPLSSRKGSSASSNSSNLDDSISLASAPHSILFSSASNLSKIRQSSLVPPNLKSTSYDSDDLNSGQMFQIPLSNALSLSNAIFELHDKFDNLSCFASLSVCFTFQISTFQHYGSINSCRIGDESPSSVPPQEIYSGLFFLCHLMSVLSKYINIKMNEIQLVPIFLIQSAKNKQIVVKTELKNAKDESNFQEVIFSIFQQSNAIFESPALSKISFPYKIDVKNKTISSISYNYSKKTKAVWTLAMKYLLCNFKIIQTYAFHKFISGFQSN